jgi:hypothetical protein
MKLKVIYNKNEEREKWIVWERNITTKGLSSIQTFTDNYLKELVEDNPTYNSRHIFQDFKIPNPVKEFARILAMDESNKPYSIYFSSKYPTDAIRNLTVSEYLTLGMILRKANKKYNKKKDEFTTCI